MGGKLHEQFDRPELPLPSDRSVGILFATVALIVAYLWRTHTTVLTGALALAFAMIALSMVAPSILRPLNIAWMRLAHILSKVMNPIVMLALFAVAIIPTGLIMQLVRDPLRRRKSNSDSYWICRTNTERSDPPSMKNQF